VTLTDIADTDTQHRMLTAARSWKNPAWPLPPNSRCVGRPADWLLSSGENPLMIHHPMAASRDLVLGVVDRVLSEVQGYDTASADVQKVRNYDRVDNYIAALKVLAV